MATHPGPVARLLATAAVLASLVVVAPSAASAQQDGFSDVTGGDHKPAIEALAGEGLFNGTLCGDARFCPDDPVTRSTAAVWLIRALGEGDTMVGAVRFEDVDADEWWARFTERLAELGIDGGCDADLLRFCPDDPLTRAEAASLLVSAFDLEAAPPAGFRDTGGNTHEADIDAVAGARIIVDCDRDPQSFCPDEAVTRADLATYLARAVDLVPPPAEFSWSLPSHCPTYVPADPHAEPQAGCPMWWGHLLDLMPSPEGITVAEMQERLDAALPIYTPSTSDNLGRLSARTREVVTATLVRLAAEDPRTAAQTHTISARRGRCRTEAYACAPVGAINFDSYTDGRWSRTVSLVVHEWAHIRDRLIAPGGAWSISWCNRIAERLSVAEATGRIVTHTGLLEAAGEAHRAPLVANPGCAEALIARMAPEIASHDLPRKITELSANAQTQAWMRRGHASPEARWWAAEAAAGYPSEPQPLEHPLMRGPLPEPLAEPDEPGNCNDGMHDHPFRRDARHYHAGGLEPHTHDRWHILADGVAVPSAVPVRAGDRCEYPDGRRTVGSWTYGPDTGPGNPVSVTYRRYSPDGHWQSVKWRRCVFVNTPGHPRYDPSGARDKADAHEGPVCDGEIERAWVLCSGTSSSLGCPTEENFADGDYDGEWIACEIGPIGEVRQICRESTGQPRAR